MHKNLYALQTGVTLALSLKHIKSQIREYNVREGFVRLYDDRPLQCSLYVTDRCNLDCAYCTEYDNTQPHPDTETLKTWIHKIRSLGTMRLALVGGEPLLHPDIVEIVRYARELGFTTSLTTNGFLLTPELIKALENAGLQTMQISVDRMTPGPITRKSFKTILPKLDYLSKSSIRVHITGVICADTLDECRQVLETGLAHGIPTELRLVHAGPDQKFRVDRGSIESLKAVILEMMERKRRGEKIHTNEAILRYQLDLLEGRTSEWTCMGGYKIFFVSARGQFWICSMVHTSRHIMDITRDDLKQYYYKKACQDGCGVYCVVSTSMIVGRPVRTLSKEVLSRSRQVMGDLFRR